MANKIREIIRLWLQKKSKKAKIYSWKHVHNLKLSEHNIIYSDCRLSDVELGKFSYIGGRSKITKCKIGNYVSIGEGLRIVAGVHPTEMLSTHPIFYSVQNDFGMSYVDTQSFEEYKYCDENKRWFVEIGNDVWIGENVSILNGIKIGNGAIIATGAVVTKNVPPYAIVGGVPARLIRYRFSAKEISQLLDKPWWEKDEKWLQENAELFGDVQAAIQKL